MIEYIKTHKIPGAIQKGDTIKKDLLYQFGVLFTEKELKILIASKMASRKKKRNYLNRVVAKMNKTNDFFVVAKMNKTNDFFAEL